MNALAGRHPPRSIEGNPMFRKIRDGFTATHFTILALGAMFVPSTLYAVVSYQPVAIVNANTGYKASVDTNGRLFTYDPVTDPLTVYASTPANYVSVFANVTSNAAGNCALAYAIPSGKALVLTSVTSFLFADGGTGTPQLLLSKDSACTVYVAAGVGASPSDTKTEYFGQQGVNVASGSSLYISGFGGIGTMQITGYLVPASAVPNSTQVAAVARSGRTAHLGR